MFSTTEPVTLKRPATVLSGEVKRPRTDQIAVFAQQDPYGDSGFNGVAGCPFARGQRHQILRLNYQRNTVDVDDAVEQLEKPHPNKSGDHGAPYRARLNSLKTRDLYPGMIYATFLSWAAPR
jgi:hypothetical protein